MSIHDLDNDELVKDSNSKVITVVSLSTTLSDLITKFPSMTFFSCTVSIHLNY